MAGDWIKVRKKLPRDGRVIEMSRKCRANRATMVGALVMLWMIADEYAEENGHLFGYTIEDIDNEIGVIGFCDAMPKDWLEVRHGKIYLPNYQQHNGDTAKKRAENTERQSLSRKSRDKSATREEKRREENIKYNPLTPKGESDLFENVPNAPEIDSAPQPGQNPVLDGQDAPAAQPEPRKRMSRAKEQDVDPLTMPLPAPLDTAAFRRSWSKWFDHRRQNRHSLRPATLASQIDGLAKVGEKVAIAMIEQSIFHGWRGLFPVKQQPWQAKPVEEDPHAKAARLHEQYLREREEEAKIPRESLADARARRAGREVAAAEQGGRAVDPWSGPERPVPVP